MRWGLFLALAISGTKWFRLPNLGTVLWSEWLFCPGEALARILFFVGVDFLPGYVSHGILVNEVMKFAFYTGAL